MSDTQTTLTSQALKQTTGAKDKLNIVFMR